MNADQSPDIRKLVDTAELRALAWTGNGQTKGRALIDAANCIDDLRTALLERQEALKELVRIADAKKCYAELQAVAWSKRTTAMYDEMDGLAKVMERRLAAWETARRLTEES